MLTSHHRLPEGMGGERDSDRHDGVEAAMRAELDAQRLLACYIDLFVQRFDTFALQNRRSRRYHRVLDHTGAPVPLTLDILRRHLHGMCTIGLYAVDRTGCTKWSVIDSDRGLAPLLAVQAQLAHVGIESYLEQSRVGGHAWVFWSKPVRADLPARLLRPLIGDPELFPAGARALGSGLGTLIRAPFGVHQFSGERYPFIDNQGESASPGQVAGQIAWLASNVRKAYPDLHLLSSAEVTPTVVRRPNAIDASRVRPIAAWLRTYDIRQVVGQYVALNRSGVGHCPWGSKHKHNDAHPSFAVFDESQRWYCFAEHSCGNAFDFLCRYYNCDAAAMLARL